VLSTPDATALNLFQICRPKGDDIPGFISQCCRRKAALRTCGRQCVRGDDQRRNANCTVLLPAELTERSFRLGWQAGALSRLRRRLACSTSPAVRIAIAGGSVTAGPGGTSWADHMLAALQSDKSSRINFPYERNKSKLASNGVGPAYLSACWEKHFERPGREVPDVTFLEYAVNDLPSGDNAKDMEALVRKLVTSGTVVVILHHFASAFMPGMGGYRGLYKNTAEGKHERVARHYGLSSVSVGDAVGLSPISKALQLAIAEPRLPFMNPPHASSQRRRADDAASAVWHPCAFWCSFMDDKIHPTKCGQKMISTLAVHAVRRLLLMDKKESSRRTRQHACPTTAVKPSRCMPLPSSIWGPNTTSRDSGCGATASKCLSNVGPRESWNLQPASNTPFKLIDLKNNGRQVPGSGAVFKMLWEGRTPGNSIEFSVPCSSSQFRHLRVMYLTGHAINYGFGSVHINGILVGTLDAYRHKQGSLFVGADFAFPSRCSNPWWLRWWPCPTSNHIVRITVLNRTRNPVKGMFGFGVNSIMCLP
jgi:hypothetical protein